MIIRPATSEDAASLAAISIEVWLGTYLKHGVAARFADFVLAEFTPERLRAHMRNDSQYIVLAEAEEGPVGYIRADLNSLHPQQSASCFEIATFYVQPGHHGGGVGKALLAAAVAKARSCKVPSLWLTTNAQNDPAIGFYLSQGFKQVGHKDFVIGAESYLNVLLQLDLD